MTARRALANAGKHRIKKQLELVCALPRSHLHLSTTKQSFATPLAQLPQDNTTLLTPPQISEQAGSQGDSLSQPQPPSTSQSHAEKAISGRDRTPISNIRIVLWFSRNVMLKADSCKQPDTRPLQHIFVRKLIPLDLHSYNTRRLICKCS